MPTKSAVNAVLKEFGLANVKMSTGDYSGETVAYRESGKLIKAISVSSVGPMTKTGSYFLKYTNTLTELKTKLLELGCEPFGLENDTLIVSRTKKKLTVLKLERADYPSYAPSANLDPSYKTLHIKPTFETKEV